MLGRCSPPGLYSHTWRHFGGSSSGRFPTTTPLPFSKCHRHRLAGLSVKKTLAIMAGTIDVERWIQEELPNVVYTGDASFLAGPTQRTREIWARCRELLALERERGVCDIDTETVSGITSFRPGYIIEGKDLIVGLQTDAPLKRACKPAGGARLVESACAAYGFTMGERMKEIFTKYR
eukprot:Polyplicarium_translucidae@DN3431_c0_g1_i1.p4